MHINYCDRMHNNFAQFDGIRMYFPEKILKKRGEAEEGGEHGSHAPHVPQYYPPYEHRPYPYQVPYGYYPGA